MGDPVHRRGLRGPWLGLLVVGAALWGAYRLARPSATRVVDVSAQTVTALREEFSQREGRAPSPTETEALVEDWARQEVLVREARAQGLDRADPIVRRRLIQKMRFVLEDAPVVEDPTDDVLERWVDVHADRYRAAPRRGFTHVFVAGTGVEAEAEARRWAVRLQHGEDPGGRGDAFAHGPRQGPADDAMIARRYGEEFGQAVAAAAVGRWFPVRSSFGWHAVLVDSEQPGAMPPLAQIRARVRADWERQQRADNRRRAIDALRDTYEVRVQP